MLWFDVEMIRYTTRQHWSTTLPKLWFDVEMIRYTTIGDFKLVPVSLWFDVEMIRYTTDLFATRPTNGCGLM